MCYCQQVYIDLPRRAIQSVCKDMYLEDSHTVFSPGETIKFPKLKILYLMIYVQNLVRHVLLEEHKNNDWIHLYEIS